MRLNKIDLIGLITLTLFVHITLFSQKPVMPKEMKGKWALVQDKNNITEFRYDTIQNSFGNFFIARLGGKWGILDEQGNEKIPFVYDGIETIGIGILKIKLIDKFGIIDTSGNKLCEINYLDIDNISRDSTILVKDQNGWKYIKSGITIKTDQIVFKKPDQIAIYGDCIKLSKLSDKEKCSRKEILNTVYKNLVYPKEAINSNKSGTIVAAFWISPTGKITHKEILKEIGTGFGSAGLKVLDYLNEWSPAIKEGKAVWSEYILPIRIALK